MEPVSHGIIFWLIIGGIAGALAGRIVDGGGFGIVVDIIVGIEQVEGKAQHAAPDRVHHMVSSQVA